MTSEPFASPADRLLRKIGRNVVNLQRLEAVLRALLLTSRLEGEPDKLSSVLAESEKKFRNSSLGVISEELNRRIYTEAKPAEWSQESAQWYVSSSLHLEAAPEQVKDKKRQLRKVVQERNQLVHRDYISFDFGSAELCAEFSAKLDEQNARICTYLAELGQVHMEHTEGLRSLSAFVQSQEFVDVLNARKE